MEDNLCFYFCKDASLKDYLTMMMVLEWKDVDRGFIVFSNASRTCVLGLCMSEDAEEFSCNLLECPSIPAMVAHQQADSLDQCLDIISGLRLALLDFQATDFCQTKRLADVRSSIAKACGNDIDPGFPCKLTPTPPPSPLTDNLSPPPGF